MAVINVSEDDFGAIFLAGHAAKDNGDDELAGKLDKLARKINLGITRQESARLPMMGSARAKMTWRDIPSIFEQGGR